MDFNEVINHRKSVRKYANEDIDDKILDSIISCGAKAPSACGLKATSVIKIKREEDKQIIKNSTYKGGMSNNNGPQEWIDKAPVILLVCVDMDMCLLKYGEEEYKKTAYLNVSAFIENMLLKTVELGLGGCYVTGFREVDLKKYFHVGKESEIVAIVTIGYEASV